MQESNSCALPFGDTPIRIVQSCFAHLPVESLKIGIELTSCETAALTHRANFGIPGLPLSSGLEPHLSDYQSAVLPFELTEASAGDVTRQESNLPGKTISVS